MQSFAGACHCGRVRFRIEVEAIAPTVCNCSVCSMKGFIHVIVAQSQFELLAGAGELTAYRFNTGLAQHTFCRHCGIHPFYTPRSDPGKVDVNVRCLEGVDLDALRPEFFDGKNWERAIETAHWQERS